MTMSAKGGDVELIQVLDDLCGSDRLSLAALQEVLDGNPQTDVKTWTFFHRACMNKLVSLEIIECLLGAFPKAAFEGTNIFCSKDCPTEVLVEERAAFPLHLVCYNDKCSSPVIKVLLEKNPTALRHSCVIASGVRVGDGDFYSWVPGSPLHYLLSRESHIDTDTIKMLIEAYPESVAMVDDGSGITPIHIILASSWSDTNKADDALYDIMTFIGDVETASFRKADDCQTTPLHYACSNKNATPRVVQLLMNYWPESVRAQDFHGRTAVHFLSWNDELQRSTLLDTLALLIKASTPQTMLLSDGEGYLPIHIASQFRSLEFCKLLIEANPNSIEIPSDYGYLPIHEACYYGAKDTIQYLLGMYPESVNVATNEGNLPIHIAAGGKSLDLCKMLIDANPESVQAVTNGRQLLPIHRASRYGEVDVVQYLINLYPQSLNVRDESGFLPIHHTVYNSPTRKQTEKIKLFLMYDPTAASKATGRSHDRSLPLHLVCDGRAHLDSVQILYDTYPEAIFTANAKGRLPLDLAKRGDRRTKMNAKVIRFLEKQMTYGIKARDKRAITTPDSNGWLLLYHALYENAPIGTIKLLVAGNPSAAKVADDTMSFPLLIACEFSSIDDVKYLLELSKNCIGYSDSNKDSPLHLLVVEETSR